MRLKEQTGIATEDLPLAAFREHLRLGTGFGEDDLQATVLEASLRAAIAAIEARTGKVLLERTFIWQTEGWRSSDNQAMPVAPVSSLSWMKLVTRLGEETDVDLDWVALCPSPQRPVLKSVGTRLPAIPTYGYAEVGFLAGYAESWSELPADLAQAVFLLAGHYYETRNDPYCDRSSLPAGVGHLIEPYRTVRILGGSAA